LSASSTQPATEVALPRYRGPVGIEARRRRLRSLALSVVGVVLVAMAALAVSRSAIFSLQHLTISGARRVPEPAIERLAGLSSNSNVVWLSTAAVEHRLLESPWIAAATVSRSLPSSVTIDVRERTPVAIAVGAGGRRALLAPDGVVLGPPPAGIRLPAVDLPESLDLKSGSRVSPWTPALRVAAGFPPGLAARVETIVLGRQGIELHTRDGVRVIYGDASEPGPKGRALGAVLVWIEQHRVRATYVDVSAPSAPAVLPVAGTPVGNGESVVDGVRIAAVPAASG
jgi:cell division protein FtsQ